MHELRLTDEEYELMKVLMKDKLDEYKSEKRGLREGLTPDIIRAEKGYREFLQELYNKFK